MLNAITLFTIDGWAARILKVVAGTPFFAVGSLFVLAGLDSGGDNTVTLIVGGIALLIGVAAYVSAILNDEIDVRIGGRKRTMD